MHYQKLQAVPCVGSKTIFFLKSQTEFSHKETSFAPIFSRDSYVTSYENKTEEAGLVSGGSWPFKMGSTTLVLPWTLFLIEKSMVDLPKFFTVQTEPDSSQTQRLEARFPWQRCKQNV